MPSLVPKILAFAVLAISVFAYAQPAPRAWWWAIAVGAALALFVFVRAWSGRLSTLAGPLSLPVTTFVVAELLLPVLVVTAALVAWIAGGEGWLDAAIVLSITLACVCLI
ncbi:hypothetical protein [Hyphomicrobium sp.]|uniref:hypothetical protein n=1 Tax=Hyphomicrobium sp. TaxID=82 RepID=UPI002E373844|nr:hypothetical protein [Hyphomicrobium sp.]HEX2839881.1 hypothetical protein [Hyphomicrobium sp.]